MGITSQLYMIKLGEQLSNAEKTRLMPFIPPEKRERLDAFHHWQDAQRTLLGYCAASYFLTKELGVKREDIRYNFDYYGKPTLPGKDIFFNISHSGDWIALGISDRVIGVDVERIQDIDLAIAEHFFAPIEVQDLRSLPLEKRYEYFFILWTLKESYIKAEGKGVSIPLDSFWFRVVRGQIDFFSQSLRDWQYRLYEFSSEYKLACCVEGGDLPKEIHILTWRDIC